MLRRVLSLSMLAALALTACTTQQPPAPTPTPTPTPSPRVGNYQYQLYRGVQVLAGTNNVDWSRTSFGVSAGGGPVATLSLQNAQGVGFPCWVRVAVTVLSPGVVGPPAPNDQAQVPAPNPALAPNALPGPWLADFDNNPAGHWSIPKAQMAVVGTSNNAAGTIAGQAFQQMVANGTAVVLNGTNGACQP